MKNTAERVDELKTDILAILSADFFSEAKTRSLQGWMLFADAQIFGRVGNDTFFSKTFVHMLDTGLPREITCFPASSGTLIFTDACYEKDADFWQSDVGGVLYDA